MKEYIKSTLGFIACIFIALVSTILVATGSRLVIMLAMSTGQTRTLLDNGIFIIILCIFTYITMRTNAQKNKNNYEKQFIKKIFIPIITSILLFAIINVAVNFFFSKPLAIILTAVFTDYNDWGLGGIEEYIFENHYFLFPLSNILQSILFGIFMILGYNSGYKKREKERQELISSSHTEKESGNQKRKNRHDNPRA